MGILTEISSSSLTPTAHEYLRVSVDKSGRERSVEEQHAENVPAALEHGWVLAERSYKDVGSASRYATKIRDEFGQLLIDLESGSVFAPGDILIIWEPSRGSRKTSEWSTMIELCEQRQVSIFVTSHNRVYDPCNYRDRRTLMEDAVDSEYESGKISMRVRRAAAANAVAGKPHGRLLYGYERIYDEKTKRFIEQRPKPGEADVVVAIITDVARGVSLKAITADLNARTVPTVTGKPWSTTQVRLVAMNIAYVGKRIHDAGRRGRRPSKNAVITDGCWPMISDNPALAPAERVKVNERFRLAFRNAQRILTDPKRKHSRPGRVKHLLSLIARCGE